MSWFTQFVGNALGKATRSAEIGDVGTWQKQTEYFTVDMKVGWHLVPESLPGRILGDTAVALVSSGDGDKNKPDRDRPNKKQPISDLNRKLVSQQ